MAGGANMEQFEAYFRRADLDQDGRISGAEAVGFLKGSNLPQPVLAQIWAHADQSRTGYLSRPEFYNALKLVTVAQSKRELTPDIVKAALYGPASAKIPAPQINLAAIASPQLNPAGAAPAQQMGAGAPTASQNLGIRGQLPHTAGMNQQYLASQAGHSVRPPIPTATTASRPQQFVAGMDFPRGASLTRPGLPNSNSSNDYLGSRQAAISAGPTMQPPNRGMSPLIPPVTQTLQGSLSLPSMTAANTKATGSSGNGFALNPTFGGETFSASQSVPKKSSSTPNFSQISPPTSSAVVPVTTESQTSAKPDPFAAFNTLPRQSPGNQLQVTPSVSKSNTHVSGPNILPVSSSGTPADSVHSTPEQSQVPWPKMTRAGVQKYAKVFMEVDSDRDGKISGPQARDLFLNWRLPREVLKQVWDLADQDNDSMLSLREFCIALYLMERYREGRPLPPTLPNSVMLDETLLAMAGPPTATYGSTCWGPTSGVRPPQGLPGVQPVAHPGLRPPMQGALPQSDRSMQFNQQNARATSMDNSHMDQLSNGEQNVLETKGEETAAGEKKDGSKDNMLLDSKEKLEFYRTKMQDLVLYKSRCDNRLNEITERALADKREAELLGKKYEEKYKQVAEIASKLTIEEASFRDTQERKLELQQAITKMEQGGSADGILQVRADRIQHDLEELLKALADRCKKHELNMKSTALIELPPGWQPGIPEISAVWDEDWDKFEDEGFSFDVAVPANSKSGSAQKESSTHSESPDTMSNADAKSENYPAKGNHNAVETDLMYMHSDEESKSPQGSPRERTAFDSPSGEYSDNHFGKSFKTESETDRFDEPGWGTFDNNDDVDSVWGFNAKESDHVKHGEKHFFASTDFGASPTRTESPGAESRYQKNSPFTFEDSVPGSPLSRAGNSPRYSVGSKDPFFDSFSRYDSFSSTHDRGSSPRKETLARFDSISSASGVDHSRGYSFDDTDPFGSSGPFKVSESQNTKKSSDHWSSF
ncbi:actin cytoskeleton-regulatory complex protein PAN1 [Capsicum annuum]|uniref:actin cytoskeleton-regulatory complex protein PAN1 n=1 Tax=Capsicum annuum TaxID=4072 RepID=UPI001FB11D87|nr:actin cytoskeleton-regulatory complex protein PAN1 [Capsicum annuum]